jgi:hypothetical protein
MTAEGRVVLDRFPQDWQYYTLTFPVARYRRLSQDQAIEEMLACNRHFYAIPRILGRVWKNVWHRRQPLINLFGSLSYRKNLEHSRIAYAAFSRECATRWDTREIWDSRLAGGLNQSTPHAAFLTRPFARATSNPGS